MIKRLGARIGTSDSFASKPGIADVLVIGYQASDDEKIILFLKLSYLFDKPMKREGPDMLTGHYVWLKPNFSSLRYPPTERKIASTSPSKIRNVWASIRPF